MTQVRERRPDLKAMHTWATKLLLEVGAIHKCETHGWAKDRTDPHARDEAVRIAREYPLAGLLPEEATAAVHEVLTNMGDTCPEC